MPHMDCILPISESVRFTVNPTETFRVISGECRECWSSCGTLFLLSPKTSALGGVNFLTTGVMHSRNSLVKVWTVTGVNHYSENTSRYGGKHIRITTMCAPYVRHVTFYHVKNMVNHLFCNLAFTVEEFSKHVNSTKRVRLFQGNLTDLIISISSDFLSAVQWFQNLNSTKSPAKNSFDSTFVKMQAYRPAPCLFLQINIGEDFFFKRTFLHYYATQLFCIFATFDQKTQNKLLFLSFN